jgi:hypothetical protein
MDNLYSTLVHFEEHRVMLVNSDTSEIGPSQSVCRIETEIEILDAVEATRSALRTFPVYGLENVQCAAYPSFKSRSSFWSNANL